MDRRTLLALLLTAVVIVVTPMLFPAPQRPQVAPQDTSRSAQPQVPRADSVRAPQSPTPNPARAAATRGDTARATTAARVAARAPAETTVVQTKHAVYRIASPGGTPVAVMLPDHPSLRPGAARTTRVNLLEHDDRLFHLHLTSATDTILVDTIAFRASPSRVEGNTIVQSFTSVSATPPLTLTYRFPRDSFVVQIEGSVGARASNNPELVFVTLPRRIRSEEADTVDDSRHLAVGYKIGSADIRSVSFRDLDTIGRIDTGQVRWIAERNKYFVVAALPGGTRSGSDTTFRGVVLRGVRQPGSEIQTTYSTAVLPIRSGSFSLRIYAGPQSWNHLRNTATDLENVNPYGGWLHGMVQPFATIVMRMILWMRHTFDVGYGWVLVIFGILVRLLLWPLNQNAMRSSIRLQRIQPQLMEIQKKYRENPERQREAMMRLYQEHGMSPFTPILGCLPMLLPMPILFALYFVFQNTIELRGVPFLWLPDLSLKDPFYITPLFMGISMFLLSWIGMRGMPPTPQTKMMAYVMPVMFTVLFWNFASGLNLYYAVQNVAALPQQWLLARERVSTTKDPGSSPKGHKT